jgi:hypothetical protein
MDQSLTPIEYSEGGSSNHYYITSVKAEKSKPDY